jgi:hypothetical protein
VRNATDAGAHRAQVLRAQGRRTREGNVDTATLIDVIVLMLVYVGLSLVCDAGIWLIGMVWPPAADRRLDAVVATGPQRGR